MPIAPKNLREFQSLVQIMQDLRGPDGCPWDKEQTMESLSPFAIEEAYELADAVLSQNPTHICEELGDVLLQVVLNAEIARQAGLFSIEDVIYTLNEKMVRRHPHVYGDIKAKDTKEVLENWSKIKKTEGKDPSSMDFPKGFPAINQALLIGKRTSKSKFDWQGPEQVIEKVKEELSEVEESLSLDFESMESEIGDLFFTVVQLARQLDVDPDTALRKTNLRFVMRYKKMHEIASQSGKDWNQLSLQEKESLWSLAKKATAKSTETKPTVKKSKKISGRVLSTKNKGKSSKAKIQLSKKPGKKLSGKKQGAPKKGPSKKSAQKLRSKPGVKNG